MKLTANHKEFIVGQLACFRTPTEVARGVREHFGFDLAVQQIAFYDPTTAQGERELSPEWRELFAATRKRFLEDATVIPIANAAYRLVRLQRMIDDEKLAKNPILVMKALEQAARESGGAYTNKREISGPNGAPVDVNVTLEDLRRMDPADLARLHAETLGDKTQDR